MSLVSLRTRRPATGVFFAPASESLAALLVFVAPSIIASKSGFSTTSFLHNPSHKLSLTFPGSQARPHIENSPPLKLAPSYRSRPVSVGSPLILNYRPSTSSQVRNPLLLQVQKLRQTHRYYSTSAETPNMNGEARPKRKHSPVPASDRPAKHLKPESTVLTPGDETPANGTVYDVENGEDITPIVSLGAAQADSPEWQATIESVVKSVVSIHFCQTCSFDTDLSMCSQATGFVVDAKRGYILTNRHVVCAGPFWGYCIFDNHEEVSFTKLVCEVTV